MRVKLLQIGGHHLIYNLKKWVNKGIFGILKHISENFTFVQLMDILGNMNNATLIVGYWIFVSNYEKALHPTK